jgi:hypothetical protein
MHCRTNQHITIPDNWQVSVTIKTTCSYMTDQICVGDARGLLERRKVTFPIDEPVVPGGTRTPATRPRLAVSPSMVHHNI